MKFPKNDTLLATLQKLTFITSIPNFNSTIIRKQKVKNGYCIKRTLKWHTALTKLFREGVLRVN